MNNYTKAVIADDFSLKANKKAKIIKVFCLLVPKL
jgi:hypothetical protein